MNPVELAELAFASATVKDFRQSVLGWLDRHLGVDLGAFNDEAEAACLGYSEDAAQRAVRSSSRYMEEFTPREIRALCGQRPAVDLDVLSRTRRERLAMYREVYRPHGVSAVLVALGRHAFGTFGIHVARTGPRGRFCDEEVQRVASFLPALRLADGYVVARERSEQPERAFEAWASNVGLTSAERAVVRLAVRGMQNPEIACLLQSSRLTVRNHLGRVFRKAGVSNRAELAYICSMNAPTTPSAPWVRHIEGG